MTTSTRITDERLNELRDGHADGFPGLPWERDLISALDELIERREAVAPPMTDEQRLHVGQAAELLDEYADVLTGRGYGSTAEGAEASAYVLRSMLSAPGAETAAPGNWESAYAVFKDGQRFPPDTPALKVAFAAGIAWQAAQPEAPAVPVLTDDEVNDMWAAASEENEIMEVHEFARAIEAAVREACGISTPKE